jgi:hypothetical protein
MALFQGSKLLVLSSPSNTTFVFVEYSNKTFTIKTCITLHRSEQNRRRSSLYIK